MKHFVLAQKVLTSVLLKEVSFNLGMKNAFNDEKNKLLNKKEVSSLVGCALRHTLAFEEIINQKYPELDLINKSYLLLYLANHYFIKKYSDSDLKTHLNSKLSLEGLDEFLTSIDSMEWIDKTLDPKSVKFLSLRFNTPAWLVGMWNKHYDYHLTARLLKTNAKPAPIFAIKKNEDAPEAGFEPTKVAGVYKKTEPGKLNENYLYSSTCLHHALDAAQIDPFRGLVVYSEYPSFIFNELAVRLPKAVQFDYIAGNFLTMQDAKRNANFLKLTNAHLYECSYTSTITVLAHKVNTIIAMPNCSNFAALQTNPEQFLYLDQTQLDSFIENEYNCLDELSKYVEPGGRLIYLLPTVNNKEGHLNATRFLKDHSNFELVDEKQFFACNSYESSFFYAIFQNTEEVDD